MLRRVVRGTINDVSSSCPLCLGNGAKNLRLPIGAKLCPDCLGFGRRLLLEGGKERHDEKIVLPKPVDGVFGEPPKITGCSRCLSRGFILQPGT